MAITLVPIKRKEQIHIMKIDYEDWKLLQNYTWFVSAQGYVVRNTYCKLTKKEGMESIHRSICKPTNKYDIDHINGDKLDNQRCNLRICTRMQNTHNKITKGVSLDKRRNLWRSYITVNKKTIWLGYYKTEKEAMVSRKNAEKFYFKEFARINVL